MFGIEEFPISAEHASQLMRGDMCIERFLNDNLNAPDDISRFKGLLLEGDTITQETIEMLHFNIDAFYKQEVTREVKPFKKKKPSYQS